MLIISREYIYTFFLNKSWGGRKWIFIFISLSEFCSVFNFFFINMYHCYEQKQGFVLVLQIQEAQVSRKGLKTKQRMKENGFLLGLQMLTKQDSVWKAPGFCVPVRGIMETALSWHSLGDKASSYSVRGIKTNKSSEILLFPFEAI